MRKFTWILLLALVWNPSAFGLDGIEVSYVNGTEPGVNEGSAGTLDTSAPTAMVFRAGSNRFSIPYSGIYLYRYHEENRFRLGALPTIALGLLKARAKRHIVTIAWKDAEGVPHVATLEASRQRAMGLLSVLHARAPRACSAQAILGCKLPE